MRHHASAADVGAEMTPGVRCINGVEQRPQPLLLGRLRVDLPSRPLARATCVSHSLSRCTTGHDCHMPLPFVLNFCTCS